MKRSGEDTFSLAGLDVQGLSGDASTLFRHLFGSSGSERKEECKHLFRKTKDTTQAMHQAFAIQALISMAGLTRLYFALQNGSGGVTSAESQAVNSTLPRIRSVDATFAAGSCACNLLFAIAVRPVLWLADADFSDSNSILVVTSTLSSLLGLVAIGIAVSFSCRSVTRERRSILKRVCARRRLTCCAKPALLRFS